MVPMFSEMTLYPDHAKVIAMIVLGAGSIFFGMLPICFRLSERRRQPLLISNLLCFGAGVLLATSLVHMLPEVREKLPDHAELLLCCGFFLVYVMDELVHACCGEAIRHTHRNHIPTRQPASQRPDCHSRPNYGATEETQSLLQNSRDDSHASLSQSNQIRNIEETEDEEANARICHTTHTEPCEQSATGHTGLLLALSVHAILEGLAIGVQDSASKVLVLLGAVCCHKFVVGFCLGVELSSTPGSQFRNHAFAIFTFALGSVLGIGLGMGLTDVKDIYEGPALQILQSIAAGTLLYVTVCEVLPREKARWHMSSKKYAGLGQCISVLVGFSVMAVLTMYYAA